jgi:uncharacterized protein
MKEIAPRGAALIEGTESFAVHSSVLSEPLIIDVALPTYSLESGGRMPVVYVLDGEGCFGLAAQSARNLQLVPGAFPQALIVGVRYDLREAANRLARGAALRFRDFTRNSDRAYIARMRAAPPPFGLPPEIAPGGANAFLSFLRNELKPFIASRYPTNQGDQTLVGVSLAGLFALETLMSGAQDFNRYIVISPSLWWNDRAILKAEAEYAGDKGSFAADVFLGVGELEEHEDASARMVSNLAELSFRLQSPSYSGLRVIHHVFAEESHLSVTPAAIARGLREILGIAATSVDRA